eukprot:TRINITY_DN11022_c0_g1_i3.p2 TRINITY_DN11022_c0_g1~~TRINITY_DN11022_c0_g1_i3.p2  ORF type:complete len:105 (-),score=0.57 TRINITY_DN11022_c0_g1_i3:280-594(-)
MAWRFDLRNAFDADNSVLCLTHTGKNRLIESLPEGTTYKEYAGPFGMPWASNLTCHGGIPFQDRLPELQTCEPVKFVHFSRVLLGWIGGGQAQRHQFRQTHSSS